MHSMESAVVGVVAAAEGTNSGDGVDNVDEVVH